MTYDLQNFGLKDMIAAGRTLRRPDPHHGSMEEAAVAAVDFFYDNLRAGNDRSGIQNCVLVRCFKTHPLNDLPSDLQQKVAAFASSTSLSPKTQCLVLLATRGECSHWNSRFDSVSHQVIPLPTVDIVSKTPMIAQLFLQLGMKLEHVVRPLLPSTASHPTFGVFHVESALGSATVPEQEQFVKPFGVESALGFGGLLPAGELFAIILFTRVRVSPETAALFRTLALGVKLTLLPFSGKQVFTAH